MEVVLTGQVIAMLWWGTCHIVAYLLSGRLKGHLVPLPHFLPCAPCCLVFPNAWASYQCSHSKREWEPRPLSVGGSSWWFCQSLFCQRACLDPIEHELYLESYLGLGWNLMFSFSLPTLGGSPDVLPSSCQLPAQTALLAAAGQANGLSNVCLKTLVNCQLDHCLKASSLVSEGAGLSW